MTFPPDPGFLHLLEATRRRPLDEFPARNSELEGYFSSFLSRSSAYDVVPGNLPPHGPYPGTACWGACSALLFIAKSKVLSSLAHFGKCPLLGARSYCQKSPRIGEPLIISGQTLHSYQEEFPWDIDAEAERQVYFAMGTFAYDIMSQLLSPLAKLEFDAEGSKVPNTSSRRHFASLFATRLLLPTQVSKLRNRDKRPFTFSSRLRTVEAAISHLR
jgi:hypothetical protein